MITEENLNNIDTITYFARKFQDACEGGSSNEYCDRIMKQFQLVVDSFIIYNKIKNGSLHHEEIRNNTAG